MADTIKVKALIKLGIGSGDEDGENLFFKDRVYTVDRAFYEDNTDAFIPLGDASKDTAAEAIALRDKNTREKLVGMARDRGLAPGNKETKLEIAEAILEAGI